MIQFYIRVVDLQKCFIYLQDTETKCDPSPLASHSVALRCVNCGDLSLLATMPEMRKKSQSCGLLTVYLLKYHRILKQSHVCCFWRPRTFCFLSRCSHKGTAGNPWAAAEVTSTRTQSPTQKRLPTTIPVHSQL